jgi:hypothetical protein
VEEIVRCRGGGGEFPVKEGDYVSKEEVGFRMLPRGSKRCVRWVFNEKDVNIKGAEEGQINVVSGEECVR